MSMLDDDLANIFTDIAVTVPVSYGTSPIQSTRGIPTRHDTPESDRDAGVVIVSRNVVTIRSSALTGLLNGQAITVDGTTYKIHDILNAGRGKLHVVLA